MNPMMSLGSSASSGEVAEANGFTVELDQKDPDRVHMCGVNTGLWDFRLRIMRALTATSPSQSKSGSAMVHLQGLIAWIDEFCSHPTTYLPTSSHSPRGVSPEGGNSFS